MVKSNYKYISWKQLIKSLWNSNDVEIISQRWSHIKITVNWIKTIVPNHKELAYWTFSWILKQVNIDEEAFLN